MKHHVPDKDCQHIRMACESRGGVLKFWMSTFPQVLPELYDIFQIASNTAEFKEFYRQSE